MTQHRMHVSLATKLEVALRQLGIDPATARLDHRPPLALREKTPDGKYIPDERDPLFMQWLSDEDHHLVTFGTPKGQKRVSAAGGDIHKIAKVTRLTERQEAFRARLTRKEPPNTPIDGKRKQKFPSRPLRSRGSWDQRTR